MAEYLIQDTTLTNLGDKIRVLSGGTATMTPIEMATTLDTHNTEMTETLATQDDLIAQIAAALEGKSAGGGSSVPIVSVTITDYDGGSFCYATPTYGYKVSTVGTVTEDVLFGEIMYPIYTGLNVSPTITGPGILQNWKWESLQGDIMGVATFLKDGGTIEY